MGIEVIGKLHVVMEAKQVSERFRKREFVLELADSKYPQTVLFQATGDRCEQLDEFQIGDQLRVEFSLRGREWKAPSGEVKYFNTLDVWKVEHARQGQSRGAQGSGGTRNQQYTETYENGNGRGRAANGGGGGGGGNHPNAPMGDDNYGIPSRGDDDIPF